MNDLIPTEAQRHREKLEQAEEFFMRNPALQEFRRKLNVISGENPMSDVIRHSENLIEACKFFKNELQTHLDFGPTKDWPSIPVPDPE